MLFPWFCIAEPFGTHHNCKEKPYKVFFVLLDFGVVFSLEDIGFLHIIVGLNFLVCLRFSPLSFFFLLMEFFSSLNSFSFKAMCLLHLDPNFGVASLNGGLNGISTCVRSLTKLSSIYLNDLGFIYLQSAPGYYSVRP